MTKLGTAYDFSSVMHYEPYAFAKDDSKPTITRIDGSPLKTQREGFSATDIVEINKLYNCGNIRSIRTTTTSTYVSTWYSSR